MPITANAKKALRQQKMRAVRNGTVRSQVRTEIKKNQKQPSEALLPSLFSVVDKAVKRHVLPKNRAARIKAQAAAAIKTTPAAAAVKKTVKRKPTAAKKKKTTKK